jgi:hypothetical protein
MSEHTIPIDELLQDAFLSAKQERATAAIAEARAEITREGKLGASNIEVIVPSQPDEAWLQNELLRPLVTFCQSTGAALPDCAGVFVTLYAQGHIHFVLGAEVVAWACPLLGVHWRDLVERYGVDEPAGRHP